MDYVWYVGYGSNICEQRFLCYIKGGTPRFGKKNNSGCTDKTRPVENKPATLGYPLYFALPDSNMNTSNWGYGGVAFIDPQQDNNSKTLCRMWKITKKQYDEVREQEGHYFYGKEILLGEDSGIPVYTITSNTVLDNIGCPSASYIKTIAIGLKETYNFRNDMIIDYFLGKAGIIESPQKCSIPGIINSL